MTKLSILLVILVALIGLSACQPKPETAANAFFKALETQDFEAAKEISTEEGQQLLSLIQSFAENADEEQLAEMKNTKYKVIETKVEGDSAVVVNERGIPRILILKKVTSYRCARSMEIGRFTL